MIYLYSGTPGSGKSLHAASDIRKYLRLGYPVITNFELKAALCNPSKKAIYLCLDNQELTPDRLVRFSEWYKKITKKRRLKEDTILCVIDEAQLLYNARNWQGGKRLSWISFFSQHRKLGYRVILVAQYIDMMDKQIRPLIEFEYKHKKLKNMGLSGKLINFLMLGGMHAYTKYYSPTDLYVETVLYRSDSRLYSLYDSYNTFSGEDQARPAKLGGADPPS